MRRQSQRRAAMAVWMRVLSGISARGMTTGTAASFEAARSAFLAGWRVFLSNRTEADFQAWRDQRDWTAEKYRRFDRGERMPHDWRASATPDVILGGRTERAIDLRYLQLASDIRSNRRDTHHCRLPPISMIFANLDFYLSYAQRRNDHVG